MEQVRLERTYDSFEPTRYGKGLACLQEIIYLRFHRKQILHYHGSRIETGMCICPIWAYAHRCFYEQYCSRSRAITRVYPSCPASFISIIIARYAAICVVIVSWRSHRYAALLFLASDYISNNYFYVSERGGTLVVIGCFQNKGRTGNEENFSLHKRDKLQHCP